MRQTFLSEEVAYLKQTLASLGGEISPRARLDADSGEVRGRELLSTGLGDPYLL